MVLLIEQERLIADEVNVSSPAGTDYPFSGSFGTITSVSLTSIAGQFCVYNIQIKNLHPTSGSSYQVRMSMDSELFFASGAQQNLAAGATVTYAGLVAASAGSHTFLIEGIAALAGEVVVVGMQFGAVGFNDQAQAFGAPYSGAVTPTVPAARETPIGETAYTTLYVAVAAKTSGVVTNMENIGDNLTNGVSLSVTGGSQINFTQRYQDSDVGHLNGSGGYFITQSPLTTSSWAVTISKRNAATVANVYVIACPWILFDEDQASHASFPVPQLDFPQSSTLYVNLEPLFLDPTKTLQVGKKRAVSFGDASDFYYAPSGTGVLPCNYTVQIPEVDTLSLFAYGFGGCINQLGVDTY